MKKITLLAVAALAISFASCKKDYTCECTSTSNGVSATASSTYKDTKKNATESCEKGTASSTAGGVTVSTTCKIK